MFRYWLVLVFVVSCSSVQKQEATSSKAHHSNGIQWRTWSADLFESAQRENKFVILDLEAVWCHWCHVMEERTYSDPEVIALVKEKFIAVRVDQDARPDISRRYEDWGWPATIFFAPDGTELVKRAGFIPPLKFLETLNKIIKDPRPEEIPETRNLAVESPFLGKELKKELVEGYLEQYDSKLGGWGKVHKFLFGDNEEYALRKALSGEKEDEKKVRRALTQATALIDPVWGGVYQYSVENWKQPHFEKILSKQMDNLILYSYGYLLFKDPKYLKAVKDIRSYMNTFLRDPSGAYCTSQDADLVKGQHSEDFFQLNDQERRRRGIPTIDRHMYARENGWAIQGMLSAYIATGDETALTDAKTAAEWVLKNRKLVGGGFRHDEKDVAGPYLGDSLEMGWAMVKLYETTGDRVWLKYADEALGFIHSKFSYEIGGKRAGYATAEKGLAAGLRAQPVREENIRLARFSNSLFHYTANKQAKQVSEQAMRFVAAPDVASDYPTGGVLLADLEISEGPVHMTVVGSKNDPEARKLFLAAIRYPTTYKRVDWWDKTEGPLPNADVTYPTLERAAAFACADGRCSLPSFTELELHNRVKNL